MGHYNAVKQQKQQVQIRYFLKIMYCTVWKTVTTKITVYSKYFKKHLEIGLCPGLKGSSQYLPQTS